ncbi:MAG: ABC-F family ATP-binding cassette domain-containing protein [Lachnospiraceae bacterium]|nr:ABC-F family ATP-binding cassette domain-containing protein [Lachnospiraceae bacterium]MBO5144460.1 ABC-F family ATP-binding cassette domain-containing protein [Lachnospiraceae bacterium]
MNLINIENITKYYTDTPLFDNASFTVDEQEKVGIIGINGTGKTTLLKMLTGLEEPDKGTITRANHIMLRYLPQAPDFRKGATALEAVMDGNLTHDNEWSLESDAKTMLQKLGIRDYDQRVDTMSGGQRKRIALAGTLLSKADVLVLDEPTNHLDSSMADWLEEYLKNFKGALVMVTHDRYFLDSVSNRIVEIDKGKTYSYQTNYSGFLELKAQREDMELATERKRQSILRVELEWMQRGARARSTKQKAHIQRYESLAAQKGPQKENELELSSVSTRMGKTTVELRGITKGYEGKTLINDFSYIFLKNDRIGFIGENGCGKSTLMKIICGMEKPDAGEVVIGQTIKIGYYAQEIRNDKDAGLAYMKPDMRVIDYIRNTAEYVQTADGSVSASVMLDRFLFPPEKQYSLLGKLSGGEKRRLNLLRVLMEAPNVLILDEPTNDLDIRTLTILEDYLDHFDGIVITVSHDRYFLDRVVRRIFAFQNGAIKQYEGGFTDYQARLWEEEASDAKAAEESKSSKPEVSIITEKESGLKNIKNRQEKLKFSYKEQKEYETIDDEIAKLEEKLARLDEEIVKNSRDFVKLGELTKEKEAAGLLLEEKMERWMYLQDLAEKIAAQGK